MAQISAGYPPKGRLLRFLARRLSCTSRKIVVGPRFRRIGNQRFAPNPCRNLVSSPGLQSLQLVISHLAQLRVTTYPRFAPWNPVGARASFRSHTLAPLRPDLGSPMLVQTSQVVTVRRNTICCILVFCRTPGPPAIGR